MSEGIDILQDGHDVVRMLTALPVPDAMAPEMLALRAHLVRCHAMIVRQRAFAAWVREHDPQAYWRALGQLRPAEPLVGEGLWPPVLDELMASREAKPFADTKKGEA